MNAIPYTYCLVRYVHDPSAGEMLNVGVVLFAPAQRHVAARLEHRYERLSNAFSGFDGDHYRKMIRHFENALTRLQKGWSGAMPELWDLPPDASALVSRIWPDADLSFRAGTVLAGVSSNLEDTLGALFERLVASQAERPRWEKRTDEEVWSVYHRSLAQEKVHQKLQAKTLATPEFKLEFKHAFKNERWHVLQPVSMDYVRADTIQSKATRWLGNAVALEGHPELGKLYLLLGPPHLEAHRLSYRHAKDLLHKMPIDHELIEEKDAEAFAHALAASLREHGLLDEEKEEE